MALPVIPTATPPITVTKSDGTTISVPSPVVTPLTNGVKLVGAREVIEALTLDTNFVQIIEHYASAAQPTTPLVGQVWYDTSETVQQSRLKVWTGASWEYVSVAGGELALPGNTTIVPAPASGAGTSASPYVVNLTTLTAGETGKVVANITVTGLRPLQFVPIVDLNSAANGGRFIMSGYLANSAGTLNVSVLFNDSPASAAGTVYTAQFQIGLASVYINFTGTAAPPPVVFAASFPSDLSAVASTWSAANDTLTSTGCILLSSAAVGPFSTGPLSVTNGGTYYTKWNGSAGSGTCIDSADGTTITGSVVQSGGGVSSGSLTVDKTPTPALSNFTSLTGVALSSVSTSNAVTVSGINSYAYITGSTTGSTLEASINGGAFTAVPASGTSMVITSGQTLQIRHTNSGSNSTTSTATINVGSQGGITFASTTLGLAPAVSTPSITSPVSGATGVLTTPSFAGSAFSSSNGAGTHASSEWEIWTGPGGTGTLAASSGVSGTALTSWTPSSALSAGTTYYARVRYTSTATVATSSYSADCVFTTAAASNWTPRGPGNGGSGDTGASAVGLAFSTTNASNVIWDGTKYIGMTQQGKIWTSPDGINWTNSGSVNGTMSCEALVYNPASTNPSRKYITIGDDAGTRTYCYSSDGLTWTTGTASTITGSTFFGMVPINGSAKGPRPFIGQNSNIGAMWSDDGTTWTSATYTGFGSLTNAGFQSVVWDGSKYVAAGYWLDGGTVSYGTFTSTDGKTWAKGADVPAWTGPTPPISISYGGGKYVAITNLAVYVSTDGLAWTSTPISSMPTDPASGSAAVYFTDPRYGSGGVVWDGSKFVTAVRAFGTPVPQWALSSTDGTTWSTYGNSLTGTIGQSAYVATVGPGGQLLAVGNFSFSTNDYAAIATLP